MNAFIGKVPTWVILLVSVAFSISLTNASDIDQVPQNNSLFSTTYTQ
jgi:hypothetical protein